MQPRSDSTAKKLDLLQHFVAAERWDVALSLADSIKDGLQLGRRETTPPEPLLPASAARPVAELPPALRSWLSGWSHFHMVEIAEGSELTRPCEPVEIDVSVAADLVSDPAREVRAVLCGTGAPREVPSQLADVAFRDGQRHFRLMFQTQMAAGERQLYLIVFGNPAAERPHYSTDLRTFATDSGLQIENGHYGAHLSSQTWQLERLIYRGGHGLELFAGGEGHGEPPHIDWAHDYLDVDTFQKFRITNWEEVPNLEVERGPVCVRVRRFGFPHSPLHPVFTQSRFHIDVTYTFWSGLPWFAKRGRMEAVTDFQVNYLRDDEWVFSGYSFTDMLWLDGHGRLHEGPVEAGHDQDLWGVGFYHRDSRHAFIALWLEHRADGFTGLCHAGAPQLNYGGHGQLWSRWAASGDPRFSAGDVLHQHNVYLVTPYEGPGAVEEERRRHLEPLRVTAAHDLDRLAVADSSADVGTNSQLARPGEGAEASREKQRLWAAIAEVRDEMFYVAESGVVDLGYVRDVVARGPRVNVVMTMPHRGRPKYRFIGESIRQRLLELPGVDEVVVDCEWDPPWTPASMSARGRQEMGLPA